MSRRRQRNYDEIAPDAALGLAWYSRKAWERLREVADDVHALDDTYEDWEQQALRAIRDLESIGRSIRKVPIDIDALLAWCHEHHRRNDSKARADYTAQLMQEIAQDTSSVSR